MSRFRSRGDSSCSVAKCTKYINPPDDGGCPNFASSVGSRGIKFSQGLSGIFGSRSRVRADYPLRPARSASKRRKFVENCCCPISFETQSQNNTFRSPSGTEPTEYGSGNDTILIAAVQSAPDVRTQWTVDGIQNGNCVKSCTGANNE